MNLHKNPKLFYDTLLIVADRLHTSVAIIEKDYYVTLFLESLVKKVPNLIFKGGTSLSKCYKIINRFSEDIDLSLDIKNLTSTNKRNLKKAIIEVCNELEFELINLENIYSRRDYNRYEIKYHILFNDDGIKPYLFIETAFMVKVFPYEIKNVTSMIYDFFKEIGDLKAIEEFEMKPFEIRVQSANRTLVDKVFALCDYKISNNIKDHSRHIYDIYQLLKITFLDDTFKVLVNEVREERKLHKNCYSAQDQYDIPTILRQIIDEKIFYNDYITVTQRVLFDDVTYETSIKALEQIIVSGAFKK